MHLPYALLVVAATTLLANGTATTGLGRSAEVTTMESSDLIDMDQHFGDEKRSLRYHDKDDRDNSEDKENIEDDGEERFQTSKLQDLLGGRTSTLFQKWKAAGYSPEKIRSKMTKHITNGYVVKFTKNDVDEVVRRYRDIW